MGNLCVCVPFINILQTQCFLSQRCQKKHFYQNGFFSKEGVAMVIWSMLKKNLGLLGGIGAVFENASFSVGFSAISAGTWGRAN